MTDGKIRTGKVGKRAWLLLLAGLLLAALIAGVLLLLFLRPSAVLTYRGLSVDEEMYSFWLSVYKKDYMVEQGISGGRDTEELWQSLREDGRTHESAAREYVDEVIKAKLVAAKLYDETGASVTAAMSASIDAYVNELTEYNEDLSSLLKEYGTTIDAIKRCALFEAKAEMLYTKLYGSDGSGVSEVGKNEFYRSVYRRVKILFLNEEKAKLLKADGSFETVTLTEEKKSANAALDRELSAAASVEETVFDSYLSRSDESLHQVYESGLYVYAGIDLSSMLVHEELIEAALAVKAGELRRVSTEDGVAYVLGYALDAGAYDRSENEDFFGDFSLYAARLELNRQVADRLSLVENGRAYGEFTVASIPYNYEIKRFME